MSRHPARFLALLLGTLLLAGCGFRGAYSFNLPGGADTGSHPYTVKVHFLDVLDLVPQSGVRVRDVPVGRVTDISLGKDWTAVVTLSVNGDVHLPANAAAMIQQSSLLGEKYVELAPPGNEKSEGQLGNGADIPLSRTNRNVEVEELLGALSLVLNGGGLAQLQTINHELGIALQGRESGVKNTLTQLDTFIGGLDQQKSEINRALDSVNALAGTLAKRTQTINTALDTIGPGLAVLNQQRSLLVNMLTSLARLGKVGTRVINESGQNTVQDLKSLQPILTQLAAAGPNLAGALDLMLTYPFPASSVLGRPSDPNKPLNYRQDQRTGGYALFTNMTAALQLDLTQTLCRYAIDPASGALKLNPPSPNSSCGQPGTPPGNQSGTSSGSSGSSSANSLLVPTLPSNAVGQSATTPKSGGLIGVPAVPGTVKK
jgi:phospholipid/cholesterol/gamma-HCH transport system substrate-binding protein